MYWCTAQFSNLFVTCTNKLFARQRSGEGNVLIQSVSLSVHGSSTWTYSNMFMWGPHLHSQHLFANMETSPYKESLGLVQTWSLRNPYICWHAGGWESTESHSCLDLLCLTGRLGPYRPIDFLSVINNIYFTSE